MNRQIWTNFLTLLPGSSITVLVVSIAFLRFYDQTDFASLGFVVHPREWSNRLTLAALLAALANFGVEWDRRNRETDRLAAEVNRRVEEEQRRVEEVQRRVEEEQQRREDAARAEVERAEEAERTSRRARIEARCRVAQIRFQLDSSETHRQALSAVLALLEEYQDTL